MTRPVANTFCGAELSVYESLFRRLAHRMLADFPTVRRWEETDDIVQESMLRLHQNLGSIRVESSTHGRRLVALQIRRQLLDLARRYRRPTSHAVNHESCHGELAPPAAAPETPSLEEWADFHERAGTLPRELQAVFDLIWYGGLSQREAAEELGISLRQLQRRWRSARIWVIGGLNPEQMLAG